MNPLSPDSSKVNANSEWPSKIGIINDYVRVPYANGSSFASQYLYREFQRRGHEVTVIGPDDPDTSGRDLPQNCVRLASLPLRNHPGVRLAMPSRRGLAELASQNLDIALGQTGSELTEAGIWLRTAHRVPYISVNTVHLPSVYNVVLPERLYQVGAVRKAFGGGVIPWLERQIASVYNQGDGLIVLSEGLRNYWMKRGVKVPIFVIPRSVDPKIFDRGADHDPFPAETKRGTRLLVVCRMTREKEVARLLEIFAKMIAPAIPDSTLTLVGDGPDYDTFIDLAEQLGVGNRTFFLGERPLNQIPAFYRHADVFVYTSLSETYGQVVSEALWCGLPAVALADGMGVSQQIADGETGFLIDTESGTSAANWRFAKAVISLLHDPALRRRMGGEAAARTRATRSPENWISSYYRAFDEAKRHCDGNPLAELTSYLRRAQSLLRWTAFHLEVAGLGLLRKPALLNRHGTKQPVWEEPDKRAAARLESTPPPPSVEEDAEVDTTTA